MQFPVIPALFAQPRFHGLLNSPTFLSGTCIERMEIGEADIWIHTLQLMADLYQKKLVIRFE